MDGEERMRDVERECVSTRMLCVCVAWVRRGKGAKGGERGYPDRCPSHILD
jgi:hypothetical protein